VITKGKLAVGFVSVGVAAGALFPASAGAADPSTCITRVCEGGPGAAGLTNALTVLQTNPSNGSDSGGVSAVATKLAGNHNETVLTLA
jgi:hypothetical protein